MSGAPLPPDETERLGALHALKLLDTAPEPGFERIVRLAKALSGADVALVSLIDGHRQWFKAKVGLDVCETSRELAFCAHAILSTDVLWVEDAREDARFRDNPLVTGPPRIRFYAGAPIVVEGRAIGTVCVFDSRPQPFDATFDAQLRDLGALAAEEVLGRRLRFLSEVSRNIADTTSDAILCGDRHGRIIYWNKAAETVFGYTEQEAMGRPLTMIMPERFRPMHDAGYARVLAGEPSKLAGRAVELPGLRRNGQEFPLELSLSLWGTRGVQGIAAIVRDCSERHRQQEAVAAAWDAADQADRESEAARQTMGLLVRRAPIAVVMTDRDLRVLDVSERWSETYGRPASQVSGLTVHELFPEGRAEWDPVYRRCLEGAHERGEQAARPGAADKRWFQWEVAPWRDAGGEVGGLLLMNVDVTELVTAKQTAERSEQRLELAIDIAGLVVWEAVFKDRRLHVTGDPAVVFGRPVTFDMLVDDTFEFVHPQDRPAVAEAWSRHVAGQASFRVEHRAHRVDGVEAWVSSALELVRDPDGRARGIVGVLKDITGEKVLALETARAREAAEAANRVKSEFLANMSHELRTPLNGVLGVASALRGTSLDAMQGEMVELVQSSAAALERLLIDMLDLARLEAGPVDPMLALVDLGALARDAAAAAGAHARAKGLIFELDIQGAGAARVLADAARLRQVLDALLDNAVKFTDRGSVRLLLELDRSERGTRAVFRITDTGVGFRPADKERLFKAFEQADGSSTRRFGGPGLGLALCRSIARSLGGEIEAVANPAGGSSFSFSLELEADAGSRAAA